MRHAGFYSDESLPNGEPPRWDDPEARAVGCHLPEKEDLAVVLLFNAGPDAATFELPPLPTGRRWARKADTARPIPDDIHPLGEATPLDRQGSYTLDARSSAILIAEQRAAPRDGK